MSNGQMVNNLGNVETALKMSNMIDDSINYNHQNAAQFYETNLANSMPTQMPSRAPSISTPVGTGYNLGTEAAANAYAQNPDVIADKYLRGQYNMAFPDGRPHEPTDPSAPAEDDPAANPSGDAEKKAFENEVSMAGTIEQLLDELRKLASMEPGEGHPIFQLDAMYKGSDAVRGPSVEPMQTPMAGGRALTTFNLGNR